MAEASSELPVGDCNNPYHLKSHPSAAVPSPLPSTHHFPPFHPNQSSSFHCLPYPPNIVPPPPPPHFSFSHSSQTQHLPAFLPCFLGNSFLSPQCQLPCGPSLREPFQCRHCGAWNNTFFSPPALTSIMPPHTSTSFSQPFDGSVPLQSLKLSAEEPKPQHSYDQSLQVDLDVAEEADDGVEEYVEEEEEEEDEEDEEPQFVLTDEWLEFFAKSEARRKEKKRQQKKEAKAARKAARLVISQQKGSDDANLSEDMVLFETGSLPSSGAQFNADKLESVASASATSNPAQQSIDLQGFQDGMERPFCKGFNHSGTEESTLVTSGLSSGYVASTVAEGGCDELESGSDSLIQHAAFDESQKPREESSTSMRF